VFFRSTLEAMSATAILCAAALAQSQPAQAQDYYKGKTITLYAGMPPGGGIDSEMRMVAHYFGRFIPGEPVIIPRNMQGAGGMILGNYLSSVAKPDGLTLGMPGRSGFVLAPIVGAADVKYDLRKFSWIGSSASSNYMLWMRKQSNIRTVEELKGAHRQIIIAGSGSTTANSIIPEVLARYEGFPIKVVRGYPGMNDAILAVERGEADGVLTQRASLRGDLVSSGAVVPIVQVFSVEPDLPSLDRYITKGRTRALLELLNAPQHLGLALVAPPGMPDSIVKTLRQSYLAMVASKDYQNEAIKRSFDVGKPNPGDEIADYVAKNLSNVPAAVIQDYREYVERQ
jgi:tripartite-type tricarboxylate transporter receptor subunit TctC